MFLAKTFTRSSCAACARALTLILSVGVTTAVAAPGPAERAAYVVESRQASLHLMGYYIGPLAGMARGKLPIELETVQNNASRIAALAPMLPETFAMDTRAFELETEALPVIWEQMDDFKAKAIDLQDKAQALATLAAGGKEDGIRAAIGAMGQACGSCHDDYRVDDE